MAAYNENSNGSSENINGENSNGNWRRNGGSSSARTAWQRSISRGGSRVVAA
jgi:hypothetical protein